VVPPGLQKTIRDEMESVRWDWVMRGHGWGYEEEEAEESEVGGKPPMGLSRWELRLMAKGVVLLTASRFRARRNAAGTKTKRCVASSG